MARDGEQIVSRVAHPRLADDEIAQILGRPISATIAFVDAKGYPRMAPCWFLWRDDAFFTTSNEDKFHVRCLRRNPRGSFCVEFEDIEPHRRANRQVKGVGEFEILERGADEVLAQMRGKYLGASETAAPSAADMAARMAQDRVLLKDRVLLRLAPDRLAAHGSDMVLDRT